MFSAFAVDPSSLVTRLTEGLRLMKALWTEPRVDCEGRFWQLQGAAIAPPPFQKPHPPIWFGANHPAALARTVRHGDGFFGAGQRPPRSSPSRCRSCGGARQGRLGPGQLQDRQARLHRDRRRRRACPSSGRHLAGRALG